MARRIKIHGQKQYLNGNQFVIAASKKYGISEEIIDDAVTAIFTYNPQPPMLRVARNVLNHSDIDKVIDELLSRQDLNTYVIGEYISAAAFEMPERETMTLLNQIRLSFEDAQSNDEDFEHNMTRLTSMFSERTREIALAKSKLMQAGEAKGRSALQVQFPNLGFHNLVVEGIMKSQRDYTNGVDTADIPNPAVRIAGETELVIRRMLAGDSLLLFAAQHFDPEQMVMSEYWSCLCEAMLQSIGALSKLNPSSDRFSNRQSGKGQFKPDASEINLIIDYCKWYGKLPMRNIHNILLQYDGITALPAGYMWSFRNNTTLEGQAPQIICDILRELFNYRARHTSNFKISSFHHYYDDRGYNLTTKYLSKG